MARSITLDCHTLRQLYEVEQLSMVMIAAQLGCSAATVSNHVRRCGIATRSGRFTARPIAPDQLRQLYQEERLPLRQIAARLGVSLGTIHNRRRALGLSPRGRRRADEHGRV